MDGMIVTRGTWTRDDLAQLPDDGNRYEIIDGTLVVSPAPSRTHQRVSAALYRRLHAACPDHLEVLTAPLDIELDDRSVLQPDLLVARRDQEGEKALLGRPELAVEVLSPSTRSVDRTLKLHRYERAGTPAYWLVGPIERSVDVYEPAGGRYSHVVHIDPGQSWTARTPFEVTLAPSTWVT